jgi:hypothetical protein
MVIKEPKRLSSKHRSSPSSQHLFLGNWGASPVIRSTVCTPKAKGNFGQLDPCRHTQPSGKLGVRRPTLQLRGAATGAPR